MIAWLPVNTTSCCAMSSVLFLHVSGFWCATFELSNDSYGICNDSYGVYETPIHCTEYKHPKLLCQINFVMYEWINITLKLLNDLFK